MTDSLTPTSCDATHQAVDSNPAPAPERTLRPIRSFVLREGRLTLGQERAFRELWPRFGVDWQPGEALDPGTLFAPRPLATQPDVASGVQSGVQPSAPPSLQPNPRSNPQPTRASLRADANAPAAPHRASAAVPAETGLEPPQARPITLEIGFGDGESLAAMAAAAPERHFIGLEVHRPGVGHLLLALEQRGLSNVRVLRADATALLATGLPAASLDAVQLFFPDPWPKKRHHKRRIVQPAFIAAVARALRADGRFHLATDWTPYAEWMLRLLDGVPDLFENLAGPGQFSTRPAQRPLTKFERRGQRLGHQVHDLIYRRR